MSTVPLTEIEREFLENGGSLWCVQRAGGGWKVLKLSSDTEAVLPEVQESEYQAVRLALLLTDLSPRSVKVATHHAISRPAGVPVPHNVRRPVQHANPFRHHAC
jgi:hypothetical protein